MIRTLIGTWHETTARELQVDPSYYAADWMTIKTTPGDYPVYLDWDLTGFTHPMPNGLQIAVDANILDGAYHSGFGGVNYASTPIKPAPYTHNIRPYTYESGKLVDSGALTLDSDWTWITLPNHGYIAHAKEHWTPQMVRGRAV